MRLGVCGGSFNPVHYGHLLLAECCREQRGLDEVWFVPAAIPPHKQSQELAAGADRLEMLKLAIGGHEAFRACDLELRRGGVSYTVDTLEQLAQEDPSRELFFLLGADSLADLPTWKNPERICSLATLAVVRRAGWPEPDFTVLRPYLSPEKLAAVRENAVIMPWIDLRSSEVRRRVRDGLSIRYHTPRAVEKYIEAHRLYAKPESPLGGSERGTA